MAKLTKSNGDLEQRNSILETYLKLQDSPEAGKPAADNEWWLDAGSDSLPVYSWMLEGARVLQSAAASAL